MNQTRLNSLRSVLTKKELLKNPRMQNWRKTKKRWMK